MSYKARIEQDLDRWIASGLVPADSRAAILASIPDARRLDAATALAWVGGVLMGIAVIAFVAANWDGMSRLARFGIVLAAFLALAAGGAWAAQRQRPILADILLTVTVLVFAASIGLVGQIFDIVGAPRAVPRMPGAYAVRVADSTGSGHQNDTRPYPGDGGFGIGTLVFLTDGQGHGTHYGWYGTQSGGYVVTPILFGRVGP